MIIHKLAKAVENNEITKKEASETVLALKKADKNNDAKLDKSKFSKFKSANSSQKSFEIINDMFTPKCLFSCSGATDQTIHSIAIVENPYAAHPIEGVYEHENHNITDLRDFLIDARNSYATLATLEDSDSLVEVAIKYSDLYAFSVQYGAMPVGMW